MSTRSVTSCCSMQDAGFDHILLQMQVGKMRHEDILESMRLFAAEILPEFHERDAAHQEAKMQRLQPAIDRALERRERLRSNPQPVEA